MRRPAVKKVERNHEKSKEMALFGHYFQLPRMLQQFDTNTSQIRKECAVIRRVKA
jgi:hypothetical protein